jgi:hypothetical protein
MRFLQYLKEDVAIPELKDFERRWLNKLKPFGLTHFEFSNHVGKGDFRINHPRNKPPITIKDMDFLMDGFIKKMGSQLRKDIDDVKKHIAKKRGKNKQKIPDNNIEYTIKSQSTKLNMAIALKQNFKEKGTAVILPITIQRKKGYTTKQGVEVIVERRELWT